MVTREAVASNRQEIYTQLRRRILTLDLPPGTGLSENDLAASLGVSRTPVRESLILLAEEGLVQVFPKVGSFVARVDPQRVADAQFLREAVELTSLQSMPRVLDQLIVAELRANLAAQRKRGLDHESFFGLDEAFHHGLLRLSGHGGVWASVASAKSHLDRARRVGLRHVRPISLLARQHKAVLDAVIDHDTVAAVETMREHLRAVFDDIETVRRHHPQMFATESDGIPVRRSVAVWEPAR